MIKSVLKVVGMTCQHCVETVSESVTTVVGVKKVEINLKQEKVTVEFDESQTEIKNISAKIINAGFEVVGS
jgi:copper ion binding protein